jgi:RNA polymerase sigma-70 factor (ECF subfamily)
MSDEAFARLVDDHYAGVFRFALSLARNQPDACDLTQQTFYLWATKGHSLRDISKVKTWLFTTLYREFLRMRKRSARVTSVEDLPPGEREVAAEDVDQARRMDGAAVVQGLLGVDETHRAPLALFYLEELSYLEIAETLGVPVGTVMSRLSRGKAQLRAALDARKNGGGIVQFPTQKGGLQ